ALGRRRAAPRIGRCSASRAKSREGPLHPRVGRHYSRRQAARWNGRVDLAVLVLPRLQLIILAYWVGFFNAGLLSFQSFTVPSSLPDASSLPSALNATERTLMACPRRVAHSFNVATSHSFSRPGLSSIPPPTARVLLSGLKATDKRYPVFTG